MPHDLDGDRIAAAEAGPVGSTEAPEPSSGGSRGHRLHPLSPMFEIGRLFLSMVVPGLVVLLLAAGDRYEVWYMIAFVPAVAVSLKRYLTLRYTLTPDHLIVREGLVFRTTRHIPYARIQNIDTVQNPVHRWLGVMEVRLETASGQEPEAVLRVLSKTALDEIRAGVFADRTAGAEREEEIETAPAPEAFFRMTDIDVAYFGLLSQKGLALVSGLAYLAWEFDVVERFRSVLPVGVDPTRLASAVPVLVLVASALAFLAMLQVLTVAWAFLTLYDFAIVRKEEDLRTTCGLWTHQTATLPRRRIQFLSVREGWLQRMFGRLSVKIMTAGGDSTDESQVSRKWLVPLTKREALGSILREVQPGVDLERVAWAPVHPRAGRRMFARGALLSLIPTALSIQHLGWWASAVFVVSAGLAFVVARARARRLGYSLTDRVVMLRDGVLTHVRNAVQFSKIQSVSLTQSPLDRRHRMATVRVDTAGSSGAQLSFSIPYLPLRDARRLARRLRHAASETAFRW